MARWQRTKELDRSADLSIEHRCTQLTYKAFIKYLNRCQQPWHNIRARLNFNYFEPLYSEIIIDGEVNYADLDLVAECVGISIWFATYTHSEAALKQIELAFDRSQTLGTYSYRVSTLQ